MKKNSIIKLSSLIIVSVLVLASCGKNPSYDDTESTHESVRETAENTTLLENDNTSSDVTETKPRFVTYKQEDGTYSWRVYQGVRTIGLISNECPEGHLANSCGGYHNVHSSLYAYVYNDYELENIDTYWKEISYSRLYEVRNRCSGKTIIKFIEEHGLTREEFDDAVDLVECYAYNLDVLFSGDEADASEYYLYRTVFYRRSERTESYNSVIRAITKKYDLINRDEEIGLINSSKGDDGYTRKFGYSIPELVYLLDIPRDELERIIEEAETLDGHDLSYDYDFSVIYNEDGTIREELSALNTANNGKDDIVNLSAHLGELFCRIYDWEDAASFGDDIEIEDIDSNNRYVTKCNCMLKMVREYVDNRYGWDPIDFHRDVTSKECPLRAMLDEYEVTREEFETYIDFDNYPFCDIDELYYGTAEEILELCNSEEHIEAHRERDYKNSAYSALFTLVRHYYVTSDGRDPAKEALPVNIKDANISREELIAIIAEAEKRESPTQIYYGGAFYCYDYDLSVIYNEDGSFKDLSGYDSATLNDMFCRRGAYAK